MMKANFLLYYRAGATFVVAATFDRAHIIVIIIIITKQADTSTIAQTPTAHIYP